MKIELSSEGNRKIRWIIDEEATESTEVQYRWSTRRSLDHDIVASEDPHNKTVMMVGEQNEGNSQINPEDELRNKLKRHEVQLQLLVDEIQDMKDRMNFMFERRERTCLREERLGEGFEENKENEREKQKIPPLVKQQSKVSNPEGEEIISFTKKEMRVEVQKLIAD